MRIFATLLSCFVISLFYSCCFALTIDSPPDKSIVHGSFVSLVTHFAKDEIDTIRVRINNHTPQDKVTEKSENNLCFVVSLEYGLNRLELQGLREGSIITRKTIQVYLQGSLGSNTRQAPAMFTPYVFHSSDNKEGCKSCHRIEPTVRDFRPEIPESSHCYPCHAVQVRGAVIHYPAEKGLCLFCHQVSDAGGQKYSLEKNEQEYCFTCHSDRLKDWQKQPVIHGPVGKGQCSLCHDPHNSSKGALLRMHITDLCITCHEDKATGAHVISGFYGKGHPVRGVSDPFKPDREFTCAGCHDPHAGKNRNLLRHDRKNMSDYCLLCHKL